MASIWKYQLVFLFLSLKAFGLEIGVAQIAGTICQREVGAAEVEMISQDLYLLPIGSYLKKDDAKTISRGACTLAVNVSPSPGHKLVIQEARQTYSLRAKEDVNRVNLDVELFAATTTAPKQSVSLLREDGASRLEGRLRFPSLESGCGQPLLLRANSTGTILGAGQGRVFTKDIVVEIKEEACF